MLADHLSRYPALNPVHSPIAVQGTISELIVPESWYSSFAEAYLDDPEFKDIYCSLSDQESPDEDTSTTRSVPVTTTHLLYYQDRFFIPVVLLAEFFYHIHSAATAGPPGI